MCAQEVHDKEYYNKLYNTIKTAEIKSFDDMMKLVDKGNEIVRWCYENSNNVITYDEEKKKTARYTGNHSMI